MLLKIPGNPNESHKTKSYIYEQNLKKKVTPMRKKKNIVPFGTSQCSKRDKKNIKCPLDLANITIEQPLYLTSYMKKLIFGLIAATTALAANSFTLIADENDGHYVGRVGSNQWKSIDPLMEGVDWDCISGGIACRGTLKEGATADGSNFYADNEVNITHPNAYLEEYTESPGNLKDE